MDVQSVVYSFSFAQNSEWTQLLPQQKEILAYLTGTAERNSLYKHIRFGSTATDATWNDTTQQWETTVRLAAGSREAEVHDEYVIRSSFLVSAVGQLSEPKLPSIPGLDGFAGKVMHSSRWDWSYDLRGKRVAVIGTGTLSLLFVRFSHLFCLLPLFVVYYLSLSTLAVRHNLHPLKLPAG